MNLRQMVLNIKDKSSDYKKEQLELLVTPLEEEKSKLYLTEMDPAEQTQEEVNFAMRISIAKGKVSEKVNNYILNELNKLFESIKDEMTSEHKGLREELQKGKDVEEVINELLK